MTTHPQKLRRMAEVSLEERRQILIELQTEKSRIVRERHSISANTVTHIRFFHGSSSAKARGYYHKDLLEGAVNPLKEKIAALKIAQRTSLQVATELGIPLEKVNAIWGSVKGPQLDPRELINFTVSL